MIFTNSFLQRLQYFRAKIPRELLGIWILKDNLSLRGQSELAFNAVHCFCVYQLPGNREWGRYGETSNWSLAVLPYCKLDVKLRLPGAFRHNLKLKVILNCTFAVLQNFLMLIIEFTLQDSLRVATTLLWTFVIILIFIIRNLHVSITAALISRYIYYNNCLLRQSKTISERSRGCFFLLLFTSVVYIFILWIIAQWRYFHLTDRRSSRRFWDAWSWHGNYVICEGGRWPVFNFGGYCWKRFSANAFWW